MSTNVVLIPGDGIGPEVAQAARRVIDATGADINAFAGKVLDEKRAFLRPVPEFDALRISAAYYNVPDDYELLWDLLAELKG